MNQRGNVVNELKREINGMTIPSVRYNLEVKHKGLKRLEQELKTGVYSDTKRKIQERDYVNVRNSYEHMKLVVKLLEEKLEREGQISSEVIRKRERVNAPSGNMPVSKSFSYDFFKIQNNKKFFPRFAVQFISEFEKALNNTFRITNKRIDNTNCKIKLYVRHKITNVKYELELYNVRTKGWNNLKLNLEHLDRTGQKKYKNIEAIEFTSYNQLNKLLFDVTKRVV